KKASSIKNELFKWLKRLLLYSVLAVVVIAISHYVFSYFGFLHTDIDSARYMLSALVQGEATIVALVVTLSLVAVQLAAQSYSARVIEVFRKAPDLWILMGIYGVAIFYGLGVLKLINQGNISDFEIYISGAYYFGIFAFVALVPYILKIFDMLDPIKLIDILKEEITQENILSGNKNGKISPLLPIIEIINGALEKYDYEIFNIGLDRISDRAKFIFENSDSSKLSNYFFKNLVIVGKLAVNRKDEKAAFDVIYTMQEISETLTERGFDTMTAGYFEDIGILATENGMENIVIEIIDSLEKMGASTINKELLYSTENVVKSFENLQEKILKTDFKNAPRKLIRSLSNIGESSIKNKKIPDEITWNIIDCLNNLKIPAIELRIPEILIHNFRKIAEAIVINKSEDIFKIASHILSIQKSVYKIGLYELCDKVTQVIIIDLKFIGIHSIRNHREKASIDIVKSIKDAGIKAIEHNIDASYLSPSYLCELGEITIEEKQYELTKLIIEHLHEIQKKANECKSSLTEETTDDGINKLNKLLSKQKK
ncbi:MAG: DUF2254 domain-containing protein, partial [Spirochaetes bacterium]|nr:DUF2254 domain-containing protein [Spirochaetota bacterium]